MKFLKFSSYFLIFMALASSALAETLTGTLRSINYESSKSFTIDVPPLSRVYVNSGTKFDLKGRKDQLADLKEGDKVEVEASPANAGTYLAKKVRLIEAGSNSKNDIQIRAKLREQFTLEAGQKALIEENGKPVVQIWSKEMINTLCEGSNCAGEGDIGMRLEIDVQGKKDEVLLLSKGERKPLQPVQAEVSGYTISFVEAGEDRLILLVTKS